MSTTEPIEAVVEKIIPDGKHGAYAVARHPDIGSVTFSLSAPTWTETDDPEPGEVISLSNLRQMQRGWRANTAERNSLTQQ
jgi:hypothetical protein